jgi:hypothetical protein
MQRLVVHLAQVSATPSVPPPSLIYSLVSLAPRSIPIADIRYSSVSSRQDAVGDAGGDRSRVYQLPLA